MTNWDLDYAREYHDLSKLTPDSVQTRSVNASIIPRTHKLYRDLPSLPLPRPGLSSERALTSIRGGRTDRGGAALDLPVLSGLLHFSAGITRRTQIGDVTKAFRAASCTGACYHIDLHVVSGPLDGLHAGVYQYAVQNESLVPLRDGDSRGAVVEATCGAAAASYAEAFIVLTSTFWRNAWRYEDRTYRHAFWDSGTILANLLALTAAHGLEATLLLGFVDQQVNRLIDVDGEHEAALGVVALGRADGALPRAPDPVERLALPTEPLSAVEIEYPSIGRIHEASALIHCDAVQRWRSRDSNRVPSGGTASSINNSSEPLEAVIERRGSARRFKREPISREDLSTILGAAMAPLPSDFLRSAEDSLLDLCLIVNDVAGLQPGVYAYDMLGRQPEVIRPGTFRVEAGHIAFDQEAAAGAAVNIYFLADLDGVLERFGNRGYGAAQLEGGVRGGRVYLSAYALGLRATGLTFYDDDVIEFFAPHAAGRSVVFLVAVGR